LDVKQFRESLAQAKASKEEQARIHHLQEAANHYRGELLPGFYEDWILVQREEFHQAYLNALTQLAKLLEDARQYEEAIEAVNRLIRADTLNESAYQHSMRLHALNEDRAGALQVYHTCVTVLKRELDLEPSAEIKSLCEQLMRITEIPSAARGQEKAPEEIRLVGRKPEWGRMKEAWGAVAKGRASMFLIHGEMGVGRTRLAEEMIAWVQRQGFTALTARAYPTDIQTAYAPVTAWLRNLSLERLPEIWKSELARLLPELNPAQPAPLAEAWQRQRFHEALARAILGAPQPLLLLLDDIQWADRETLAWLDYLMRFDANARLLLLATARREDLTPDAPLNTLTTPLRQNGQFAEISLPRLTIHETARLASQIAPSRLSDQDSETLFRYSEGLPLFVVELTRAGLPLADGSPASTPDRLRVALGERLSTLTPLARSASEAAAVIGRAFPASLLARAADLSEPDLLAALDELWQRHILREEERGNYDFSHDKLREFIHASLSPARRQVLHQHVAKALEETESADLWERALHLEKGGMRREASEAYFRAAKHEAGQAAYPAAQKGLTHALSLLDEKAVHQRAEMLAELARMCDITGEQEQASQAVTEALQLTSALRDDPLRLQALTSAANLATQKGQLDDARTWFDMALEVAKQLDDKQHEIKLQMQIADTELRAGKAQEARALYEQALELARQTKNHALEAEALQDIGFILPAVGESLALARKYIEDSARLRRMMGDRLGEARSLCNLTASLHAYGAYEEALTLGEDALAKNRAVNYRRGAAIVQSAQGLAAYELGQFEQARVLLEEARQEFAAIGEQDGYGLHTGSLGLVTMAEEKWDEAESLFKEALAIAEAHHTEIFAAMHHQELGTLRVLQVRWEDARPHLEAALAINLENNDNLGILFDKTLLGLVHHKTGDDERANQLADEVMEKFRVESFEEGGIIRWLWQFKGLLEALGRKDEAGEVMAKAKELLHSAAGKIKDETLRQSFLENFAHHRALMSA
jgi:predicted ATPase